MELSRPATNGRDETLNETRTEVRQSIYFRYIVSLTAMSFLFAFHRSLPFPFPGFFLVPCAFFCANAVIHATLMRKNRFQIAYPVLLYIDSSVAPFVFQCTGGFLSPFIISHLMTVIASGLIFEDKKNLSRNSVIILIVSYAVISLFQKYSILNCPVEYSRVLMANDVFFYFVFSMTLFILAGGYVFVETMHRHTQRLLDDMSNGFQSVTKGTISVVGQDFFASLVKNLADALQIPCALIGRLTDKNGKFNTLSVWNSGALLENRSFGLTGAMDDYINRKTTRLPEGRLKGLFSGPQFPALASYEHVHCFILDDSLGKPIGLLCLLHNGLVSEHLLMDPLIRIFASRAAAEIERKIADERRMEMEVQLAHSQKMEAIGHLAGGIAHDLGNVMSAISGYAELLSVKLGKDPLYQKYLGRILTASKQADDVVKQMLTFAHKDGQATVSTVDIHSALHDVTGLLERSAGSRIKISFAPNAARATVRCNAAHFQNTVMNLGINARDAIDGKDGTIDFATVNTDIDGTNILCELFKIEPGSYCSVSVTDSGSGIPKEVLPHIFEPFFSTKPKGKGTGLGLSNVWGFVEASKGAIEVQSDVGKGTVFTIHLPLHAD